MPDYEMHLFGNHNELGATTHRESTFETSSARLLASSKPLVLADQALPTEVVPQAMSEFEASSAKLAIIPTSPDLNFVWSQLPSSIASLAMPLAGRCAVAIKPSVDLQTELRDVPQPIWDLVIRLATTEVNSVTQLGADSISRNLAQTKFAELPQLAPKRPSPNSSWLADHLARLRLIDLLPRGAAETEVTALHAGLWQLHDFLDESHSHSQSIEGQGQGDGDYWHAIMHRREPDYSNAKYWFRRVGSHPCFKSLTQVADRILQASPSIAAHSWKAQLGASSGWYPIAFIDLCESLARGGNPEFVSVAERIQWAEMLILLVHCYQQVS